MAVPLPASLLNDTYGAVLVGIVVGTLIAGISTVQFLHYFSHCKKDRLVLKLAVGALWVLDMLDLAFTCHTAWEYLVSGFGNIFVVLDLTWSIKANTWTTTLITLIVHAMYLMRLHTLGRGRKSAWAINITLATLVVAGNIISQWVSIISTTAADLHAHGWAVIFPLSNTAFVDATIASALCFYLKPNTSSFLGPNVVLNRLMFYIVSSGAITSVTALLAVTMFVRFRMTLWWVVLRGILPRIYTACFMTLLNSRDSLRERLGSQVRMHAGSGPSSRPTVGYRVDLESGSVPSRLAFGSASETTKTLDIVSSHEANSNDTAFNLRPLPPPKT